MKKFTLSLITPLLFAATSAHAINVLDTGDASLDVFGRAEYKLQSFTNARSRSWFTSRLGFTGYVDQYEGIRAFFKTSWDIQSQSDDRASNYTPSGDNIRSRYQYVGLDFGDEASYGSLILGQTDTPFYSMLTASTDIFYTGGMDASAGTYSMRSPNQILYSTSFDGLSVQASYQSYTKREGNISAVGDIISVFDAGLNNDTFRYQDNAYSIAAMYDTGKDVYLRSAYAYQTFEGSGKKTDYGIGINYYNGSFYLAGIYTNTKEEDNRAQKATRQGYELASYYVLDKITILAGYAYGNQKSDVADDVNYAKSITLNIAYRLFNNVSASAGWVNYRNTDNNFYRAKLTYNF